MSRKKTMVPADLAIKVPQELVALAGELVPAVQALPAYKWIPVSKAAVLRLALARGLSVMTEEIAGGVTLPAAADMVVQTTAPGGEPAPTGTTAPPPKLQPSPPATPDDEAPASAFLRSYQKPSRLKKPATATAARLRKWRQGEGLTQAKAAELLGVGQSSYSALETGKRGPTGPQAAKLAELAGIDPDDWTTPNPEAEEG